jgi:hypothetical protein
MFYRSVDSLHIEPVSPSKSADVAKANTQLSMKIGGRFDLLGAAIGTRQTSILARHPLFLGASGALSLSLLAIGLHCFQGKRDNKRSSDKLRSRRGK